MDRLAEYREIIKKILSYYASIPYSHGDMKSKAVYDSDSDNYLLMTTGWDGHKRAHGCVIHIEIIGDKVWVHFDGTNADIVGQLEEAGIPKDKIVLGFHEPGVRPYTGYAVA
jgi:hypothetical protein